MFGSTDSIICRDSLALRREFCCHESNGRQESWPKEAQEYWPPRACWCDTIGVLGPRQVAEPMQQIVASRARTSPEASQSGGPSVSPACFPICPRTCAAPCTDEGVASFPPHLVSGSVEAPPPTHLELISTSARPRNGLTLGIAEQFVSSSGVVVGLSCSSDCVSKAAPRDKFGEDQCRAEKPRRRRAVLARCSGKSREAGQ